MATKTKTTNASYTAAALLPEQRLAHVHESNCPLTRNVGRWALALPRPAYGEFKCA